MVNELRLTHFPLGPAATDGRSSIRRTGNEDAKKIYSSGNLSIEAVQRNE
jgi:hypothetical protein